MNLVSISKQYPKIYVPWLVSLTKSGRNFTPIQHPRELQPDPSPPLSSCNRKLDWELSRSILGVRLSSSSTHCTQRRWKDGGKRREKEEEERRGGERPTLLSPLLPPSFFPPSLLSLTISPCAIAPKVRNSPKQCKRVRKCNKCGEAC